MRDEKIINGLRLGAAAAILLAAVALQARSCKELCEKFGSYEACRSLKAGINECNDTSISVTSSEQNQNSGISFPLSSKASILYTEMK